MDAGNTRSSQRARLLVGAAGVTLLFVASIRLVAIVGPPMVIWTVIRPHGAGIQVPKAFSLYVSQIVQSTGLTPTGVWLRLASQVAACGLECFVAIALFLRKRWARLTALAMCLLFAAQHGHAAIVGFQLGSRHGMRQVAWTLLYLGLGFVFTRPSLALRFRPATSGATAARVE